MNQRKVPRLELMHVAEQLGLGAMRIENRVRQKGRCAIESLVVARIGGIDQLVDSEWSSAFHAEHFEQRRQIFLPHGFVERNAHRALVHVAKIDSTGHGALDDVIGTSAVQLNPDRVEKILVRYTVPE